MDDRDGKIWMDGEFVPWAEAKVHVLTHTLHYGLGVFEGIRCYQTDKGAAIFRLDDHIGRLFDSAQILGFPMPFDHATLREACCATVRGNHLTDCYIRPMCFYGAEGMGLHTDGLRSHAMVAAWPWKPYLGQDGVRDGIRVKTSSFRRHHASSTACKAKANGNYINSMLAVQEAKAAGCDEALLLDTQGFVAEGSGENIFLVSEGRLMTPTPTVALDGITRRTILVLAATREVPVQENQIPRDQVYIADEVFLTGTAAELTPVCEVDGRRIGKGTPGTLTRQLQEDYFATVTGRRAASNEWLTHV